MTSAKNSLEIDFLWDFYWQFLKINVLLWKTFVLHTTTLMHWKARQVLRNLFTINQGNDLHMTFVAGATKINLNTLKTCRRQLYSDERSELLTYSGRSLTWAYNLKALTLFGMVFFGAAHGWEGVLQKGTPPLSKICHTYSTMMKLGTVIPCLKNFQKLYESPDTPFEFCWHQHFLAGNQQILLYQEIQI